MPENIFKNNSNEVIEQEIAELSSLIDQKRAQLENKAGIITEKELIKESLARHFSDTNEEQGGPEGYSPASPSTLTATPSVSYLNNLNDQEIETVNTIVAGVPKAGLRATLKNLITHQPFIIDAVHDLLTDSLYNEMTERGLLK